MLACTFSALSAGACGVPVMKPLFLNPKPLTPLRLLHCR